MKRTHNSGIYTFDLDIHLDTCHAVRSSCYFEVHVAQVIFIT